MKKVILPVAIAVVFIGTAVGSFTLGAKSQRAKFAKQLDAVQAMQWFNHLLWFREIESNLQQYCNAAALEKTRIFIDQEMRLLSSFYKDNQNTYITKYISDRDPALLDQLDKFTSRYGSSWQEPKCRN